MTLGSMYGIGVGPGDPELITLKAVNVLGRVPVVAFFAKRGEQGNARTIASGSIPAGANMLALYYPYTVELSPRHPEYVFAMRSFYDECAARIMSHLDSGQDVGVLCEGDPLLYGSYMYLHDRLAKRYACVVVPGVTSFLGCAAGAGAPLVSTDRVFSIIPGTLSEEVLEEKLKAADGAAIIKLGRHLEKVRRVLQRLGRLSGAIYCERGTMAGEVIMPLTDKIDGESPYFALILVPDHDGGPYRPAVSDEGQAVA